MNSHVCSCFRYVEAGIFVCIYLRIMSCGPFVIIFIDHKGIYVRKYSTLHRFGKDIILLDINNYREAYEAYI